MFMLTRKILLLWSELCRRKTMRTLAGYSLLLAAVVGPASDILGGLGAPEWMLQIVIYTMFSLLPVTLLVSWFFDITPSGFERTEALNESQKPEEPMATRELELDISDLLRNQLADTSNKMHGSTRSALHFKIMVSTDGETSSLEAGDTLRDESELRHSMAATGAAPVENNCVSLAEARAGRKAS